MKTIKYPNGFVFVERIKSNEIKEHQKDIRKSKLGTSFEKAINATCKYYKEKGIASIYKKTTPIEVVKVDYPSRNKARIVEAYYKTPSTTDYNGIYKGYYIDFEAKSVDSKSFYFEKLYHHQIEHLMFCNKLGGITFLIINFKKDNEVYILESSILYNLYISSFQGGQKSINKETLLKKGIKCKLIDDYLIDFVEAIDILIDNRKR